MDGGSIVYFDTCYGAVVEVFKLYQNDFLLSPCIVKKEGRAFYARSQKFIETI